MHECESDSSVSKSFKELKRPTATLGSDGVNSTTRLMFGVAEVTLFVLEIVVWLPRRKRFWPTTSQGPSRRARVPPALISGCSVSGDSNDKTVLPEYEGISMAGELSVFCSLSDVAGNTTNGWVGTGSEVTMA